MIPPDVRQSAEFASFMQDINWQREKVGGFYVYLKKFPVIGSFAKCPRPAKQINIEKLAGFVKEKNIFHFKISPFLTTDQFGYEKEKRRLLKSGFKIDTDPFNPTTTIQIDLKRSEAEIFKSFSEAKRRGVRRAIKHGVCVYLSDDIEAFIKIRQQQFSPLGFLITKEMQMLWKNFYPKKADLLLAKTASGKNVAGILLLNSNGTSYYWFASALKEGKTLFAPTLLVWEAVKLGKRRGSRILDFEGIYDERFPKASESWRGFTKFKEGFSDKKIDFMENFYLKNPILSL